MRKRAGTTYSISVLVKTTITEFVSHYGVFVKDYFAV